MGERTWRDSEFADGVRLSDDGKWMTASAPRGGTVVYRRRPLIYPEVVTVLDSEDQVDYFLDELEATGA